ncbi:uroporphyrinogen-III C-methyltransferase [Rhodoblastus sp.]|uniref:uroporphyrinogen-III C-methyltransferase n=1 Tax=Rhodoblastus sp. TaxID=1962975 RepID=UPI0035ADE774
MAKGVVYLVGAGPGAADLLTLRAARLIESADVLVYDRLVGAEILALAPRGVPRFDVGKQPKSHPVPQDQINSMLARLAERHTRVVRLKGGDPLLFGRGGEEAEYLARARVPFEIVPGVTAVQASAATLGLPLTLRGCANSLRLMTGHGKDDNELDYDWRALADPRTTLAIYMGLANIAAIAEKLIAHGRAGSTPVVAIARATLPDQRHVATRLDRVAADVARADLTSPVLFIVGEAAGHLLRVEATVADVEARHAV